MTPQPLKQIHKRADGIICVRSLSIKSLETIERAYLMDALTVAVIKDISSKEIVSSLQASFLLVTKRAAEKLTGIKIFNTVSAVLSIKALYKMGVKGVGLFLGRKGALFSCGFTVSEHIFPPKKSPLATSTKLFSLLSSAFMDFLGTGEDCFSAFEHAFSKIGSY